MPAPRLRQTLAVLVLLAWVHLLFAVYPTPAQKDGEIAKLAEDAVAADQSLRSQGVSEKLLPLTTEDEYVAALSSDYWYGWLQAMAFLLLGVVATVVTYRGHKSWPWVVGLSSAAYATVITYPMLVYSIGPERSFSWVTFIARDALSGGLQLKTLLPVYYLLVLPLFHLAIVIACVVALRQGRRELYAKVA